LGAAASAGTASASAASSIAASDVYDAFRLIAFLRLRAGARSTVATGLAG
jgi:hypothetical protein